MNPMSPAQWEFAKAWDGEVPSTLDRMAAITGISVGLDTAKDWVHEPWFSAALKDIREQALRYDLLTGDKSSVASANEVKAYWTEVMRDETESVKNRLRASELLAKSHGEFIDRSENITEHRHVQVQEVDLQDRVRLLQEATDVEFTCRQELSLPDSTGVEL